MWISWNEADESRACYTEWSKSEEKQVHTLTHIYGIKKNDNDEPICMAGI